MPCSGARGRRDETVLRTTLGTSKLLHALQEDQEAIDRENVPGGNRRDH